MKRFLIFSRNDSIMEWRPRAVLASTAKEALTKFLQISYSRDVTFREFVLDLSVNMSFVERFYLMSNQEKTRFNQTAETGTECEILKSRVKRYFALRPELGDRFIHYMDSGDKSLIDDEIFEFIALNESEDEHGLVVIDPESLDIVA
ncbi:hypothetical protein [Nitrosospira multiformis]|uniref:Uncharacterized protein n=1 Tax=Nitrosospira multiformis TaxID=1231 RepID=A0A1I7I3F1_9PROT|nr:hypothetical protein [Nitrosospira multiformis]SFU67455.1 hypothetical protein SAMN05216417_11411 [Nitrosospira multiformis]